MKVYFANESKNKITKDYLKKLVNRIEANSFEVFWPERDLAKKGSAKLQLSEHQKQITKAQIFTIILDGQPLDEQVLSDLGMAYGLASLDKPKKLLCALQIEGVKESVNKSVVNILDCIAKSEYNFIDCLKSYLRTVNK